MAQEALVEKILGLALFAPSANRRLIIMLSKRWKKKLLLKPCARESPKLLNIFSMMLV
jgi:hypothetical protein